jgi:hypothetical protein
MHLSWLGLLLGGAYLALVGVQMFRVISRNSFGGIFSQEFALWVLTLPLSPLSEWLSKTSNVGRTAIYIIAALLNATALYFLGMGLTWLALKVGGA